MEPQAIHDSSPKRCILVLVMHTVWSPNTSRVGERLLDISNLGKRISTDSVFKLATFGELLKLDY
jgi:hypothetical protein